MKEYRSILADAKILAEVLDYLADRADSCESQAADYLARANDDNENQDGYLRREAAEYTAKAAAYERLLTKFSK